MVMRRRWKDHRQLARPAQPNVRMAQVIPRHIEQQMEDRHAQQARHTWRETNQVCRDAKGRAIAHTGHHDIQQVIHRMFAEIRHRMHHLGAVMHLVELPQKDGFVLQVMGKPGDEIDDDQRHDHENDGNANLAHRRQHVLRRQGNRVLNPRDPAIDQHACAAPCKHHQKMPRDPVEKEIPQIEPGGRMAPNLLWKQELEEAAFRFLSTSPGRHIDAKRNHCRGRQIQHVNALICIQGVHHDITDVGQKLV